MQQILLSESYNRYQKRNHNVGIQIWHFEWCTKYRYKMFLQQKLKSFCEIAIKECCGRNNFEILALNVQPNHVHLVISLPRGMTDIKALQLIKGFTSFLLFRLVPDFRKRYRKGKFWNKGSFSSTVGFTELESVVEYVKNQDIHHSR